MARECAATNVAKKAQISCVRQMSRYDAWPLRKPRTKSDFPSNRIHRRKVVECTRIRGRIQELDGTFSGRAQAGAMHHLAMVDARGVLPPLGSGGYDGSGGYELLTLPVAIPPFAAFNPQPAGAA